MVLFTHDIKRSKVPLTKTVQKTLRVTSALGAVSLDKPESSAVQDWLSFLDYIGVQFGSSEKMPFFSSKGL